MQHKRPMIYSLWDLTNWARISQPKNALNKWASSSLAASSSKDTHQQPSLSCHLFQPLSLTTIRERKPRNPKMVMWVFGYGSLIWKAGFNYDDRVVGFIKGYRRVFYQGSTDHRGTPEFPGRTVTLEPAEGEICWGAAYKISNKEDEDTALTYLEVREKQYDQKAYVDFYTDPAATTPAVTGVMVYIGSTDKKQNPNYLGPAPLEDIAKQIVNAEGPSGPNRDYLFQLELALQQIGCKDRHVMDLADEVRRILSEEKKVAS